ncbi:MAG: calcium/sodium antiporter [Pseudomonadota bacterium]
MDYLELAAGLGLLVFAGDLLVRGAVGLSEKLGISPLIIGLTVVAFGTSAPELVISLKAALGGASGIAIGNVVGSNVANILLVLGVPALISATDCNQPFVVRNTLFMVGASIIFVALCFAGPLSVVHGVVLMTLLAVFLIESGRRAMIMRDQAGDVDIEMIDGVEGVPHNPLAFTGFLVIGLIGLPIGAHFTVEGASGIARDWGVSDAVIGLTVVAIGTSLPELAATVAAALRREAGLAIGNVIGSNMFNLLAIMGITSLIVPVPIPEQFLRTDLWVMLGASALIIPFVVRRAAIGRKTGIAFVLLYVSYMYVLLDPGVVDLAVDLAMAH